VWLLVSLLILALPGLATPWVQTTSLPDAYVGQSLAYASGYLYQAGGSSDSVGYPDGTNVFYAQVHTNGTIGAWTNATSLPEAVFTHAGVAANGFVYVLGGQHYNSTNGVSTSSSVYYAKINSDASLGSWQTANPLPDVRFSLSASVWNNRIYAIGGANDNYLSNTVYSAIIQTNGSLSAWTTQTPLPVAIFTQASVANGFLYVLGGTVNNGNTITNTVYYSKINADGTLAGWNQTASLPQPESLFGAVAANGWVFTIGGFNGSEPTGSFYGAAVKGDGSLVSWSSGTSLPQSEDYEAVAASGSYIFFTGGANSQESSSAVYSMALPASPTTPAFVSSGFTNGNFRLQLTSSTNTGFGLLASTDLMTWTNIGSGFTDTNGMLLFQDTNAASFSNRFYRAYWPLP
jgi:hypothetical protein